MQSANQSIEIIRECPFCSFPIRYRKARGARDENLEGVFWTDGKEHVPLFPEQPQLIHCENCQEYYWKRQAKKIGVCNPASSLPEHHSATWEHVWFRETFPDLDEYREALAVKAYASDEQECYIRTHIWWYLNDPVRYGKAKKTAVDQRPFFRTNLLRLRDIYCTMEKKVRKMIALNKRLSFRPDPDSDNRQPILVEAPEKVIEDFLVHQLEICRELEAFNDAMEILEKLPVEGNRELAEIRSLVHRRDAIVHRYSFSMGGDAGGTEDFSSFSARAGRERREKSKKKAWESFVKMFR